MPIIEARVKSRVFDPENYSIGDPENNEHLSILLNEDNHRNETIAIILFEQLRLEINHKDTILDFQIRLKLGNNNHIDIFDLEILLVPTDFLQDHEELEIAKEIIACWNV